MWDSIKRERYKYIGMSTLKRTELIVFGMALLETLDDDDEILSLMVGALGELADIEGRSKEQVEAYCKRMLGYSRKLRKKIRGKVRFTIV